MIKLLFFGEILWDIFGDIKKIGGAEFNKAAHAARLGAHSFLITAVGNDELGEAAIDKLRNCGIDTQYVSRNHLPTGYCAVTLEDGQPRYNLATDTAYDMIPTDTVNGSFDALGFGTLALRGEYNRKSLFDLIDKGGFSDTYFDINIREACPSALLDECLSKTTILKASREEAHHLGCESADPEEICLTLSKCYKNLKVILITLDSDGALAYDCRQGVFHYSQKPTGRLVSAVGAGDSFGACFLYNYKSGATIKTALERAVILSDFVVTRLEAVPDYPEGLLEKIK